MSARRHRLARVEVPFEDEQIQATRVPRSQTQPSRQPSRRRSSVRAPTRAFATAMQSDSPRSRSSQQLRGMRDLDRVRRDDVEQGPIVPGTSSSATPRQASRRKRERREERERFRRSVCRTCAEVAETVVSAIVPDMRPALTRRRSTAISPAPPRSKRARVERSAQAFETLPGSQSGTGELLRPPCQG